MSKESSKRSIPMEIRSFFGQQGGRSLMVMGCAGTGKTTFVLQLLEELADPNRSFYLSTRVSDNALYQQFPWLKADDMRNRIIDSSRVFLGSLYDDEEDPLLAQEDSATMAGAKDFLQSINEDSLEPPRKVDRTRLSVLLERNRIPEIERIYDKIDSILPEKSMLVIDSLEGVTNKYSMEKDELITCIQKDLVEGSNVDALFILERAMDADLAFLVDGVIQFTLDTLEGRRIREMYLKKLRATEITQPSYLITLSEGRFMSFDPFNNQACSNNNETWQSIPDTDTHYSTGTADLDKLLNGGYSKGSYNVIEVDENVSNEEYYSVVRPILLNFISQDKGIFAVLTGGDHADSVKKDLTCYISDEAFDGHVRIADYFTHKTESPYIMALGTRNKDEAIRVWKSNMEFLRGPDNKAIIDYTGFDTLEYLQGGGVAIKQLLEAVAKIKISQDIGIGIIKPGLKLTQEIMNMADTYLKITDIDKCPCIYGVKPKTIIYGIVADEEKGTPHIKLVPIV